MVFSGLMVIPVWGFFICILPEHQGALTNMYAHTQTYQVDRIVLQMLLTLHPHAHTLTLTHACTHTNIHTHAHTNKTGISGKSQFLFVLVFTTRYLDIFTNFVSPYNTVMKAVFLVATYGTLYLIFFKFKATYDSNHDTFRAEFLVIPAVGLAVLVNHEFSVMEVSGRGQGERGVELSYVQG